MASYSKVNEWMKDDAYIKLVQIATLYSKKLFSLRAS